MGFCFDTSGSFLLWINKTQGYSYNTFWDINNNLSTRLGQNDQKEPENGAIVVRMWSCLYLESGRTSFRLYESSQQPDVNNNQLSSVFANLLKSLPPQSWAVSIN